MLKLARFVRALGLLLVLGLAGSGVGCGPAGPHVPTAEEKEAGKTIAADLRQSHQKLKASVKKEDAAGKDMRRGRFRGKGRS